MLLRPTFLPCVFLKNLEDEEMGNSLVRFFGEEIKVDNKELRLVKFPVYKKN